MKYHSAATLPIAAPAISAILLLLTSVAGAQEQDSLKYFVERFTDSTLSASERSVAGQKIRSIQNVRYLSSSHDRIEADTLLRYAEQRMVAGLVQNEAITRQIGRILADSTVSNPVKSRALGILSKMNTCQADSILIANIDVLHYLGEPPGGAGGEIEWLYPCFSLLEQKSGLNYSLLTPIISNLTTLKNETELYLIHLLLENIFSDERLLNVWIETWLAGAYNPIVVTNLEALVNLKK